MPALLCLAAALTAPSAYAEAQAQAPLWELGLGAAALQVPHYRGSAQSHRWLLPTPYVVLRGEVFRADREGTRAVLFETARSHLDLSFDASPPTRSSDNRARDGMPDLAATVEVGPKFNLVLGRGDGWKLDLRLPLRAAFAIDGGLQPLGWTFAPVLHLDTRWQGWNLGLTGGPLSAGRRFHAHFYDVTPAQATDTRPAYSASGGTAGWGLSLGASRRVGPWWVAGFVRHDDLAGARLRASPLVTQTRQFTLGLALSRVLWVSERQVPEQR
ncbi:MAG: MipA/OmpV family protein [Rubrivivax sp.]|nr:MipA/OmpV family protein [Rubrivivax sp.]